MYKQLLNDIDDGNDDGVLDEIGEDDRNDDISEDSDEDQEEDKLVQQENNFENLLQTTRYGWEENWESLQKRFPHHTTEEKLEQFKGVPEKRNKALPVSASIPY